MPDFLEGSVITSEPSEGPIITEPFSDAVSLIRDVRNELRKQKPGVFATVNVDTGGAITDLLSHRIWFTVGKLQVPVYNLIIAKYYTADITVSFRPFQSSGYSGILVTQTPMQFMGETWELFVRVPTTLVNSQLRINDSDGANGGLQVYAWTTDEQAFSYQPDKR